MAPRVTGAEVSYVQGKLTESELESVEAEVKRELEELQLGRYRFNPHLRCRICLDDDLRKMINKLLSNGLTYTWILRNLKPINDARPKKSQITYSSLWSHAKVCFPKDEASQAVYRSILEKRAQEYQQDFVKGTSSVVNVYSYLETMSQKGYEKLTSKEDNVSVRDGMDAITRLHELTKESDQEHKLREIMSQFNTLVQVVQEVVGPEDVKVILSRLRQDEGTASVLDVEEVEDNPDEVFEVVAEGSADLGSGSH